MIKSTLILCKRDYWNIIEDYYTPGEDFIYFDENSELEELIKDILNNYSKYEQIIENAYNKSLNYTSKKLYEHGPQPPCSLYSTLNLFFCNTLSIYFLCDISR